MAYRHRGFVSRLQPRISRLPRISAPHKRTIVRRGPATPGLVCVRHANASALSRSGDPPLSRAAEPPTISKPTTVASDISIALIERAFNKCAAKRFIVPASRFRTPAKVARSISMWATGAPAEPTASSRTHRKNVPLMVRVRAGLRTRFGFYVPGLFATFPSSSSNRASSVRRPFKCRRYRHPRISKPLMA